MAEKIMKGLPNYFFCRNNVFNGSFLLMDFRM